MARINIELEQDLHKKAKLHALLKNQTLIEYIHEALEQQTKKDQRGKK
jgi:predicted HicB family RNase H-like nuclease|tara:strand:+ start:159 stop:302 length:144 start_codon:yes stop_codon:yes gene_type:complete